VRARAVGDDKYYSIAALKEFMAVPVVKKKKADDDSSKREKKEKGDDDEPKVQPIPERVKQDMIRDMADTAKTHASSMAARCRNVLSYEVEVDLEARGGFNKDQIKAICAEAKKTLDVVPVVTFATSLGPLGNEDRLVKLVRSYQEQLPTELPANFESKKPTPKKEPKKSTRKNDKAPLDRIADKIPHVLFKVATFASRRLDTYYPPDERHEDDFEIEDYTKDVEEADDDDEDGVGGADNKTKCTDVGGDGDVAMKDKHPEGKDAKKTEEEKKKWDRRRPKRFAFLPIWKLSAAMVEYVYSGLAVNWTKDAFDSEPRVDSIAGDLFPDLTFIPQLKYRPGHPKFKHWYLEGFRTNGVELQLRLVCCQGDTPSAFNAANLCKRGYQLSEAPRKVPAKEQVVDSNQKARDMTRFRGTVKLYQDHCDLVKKVLPEKIVSVDPGENIPIQVGEISKQVPLKAEGTVDGTATTIENYTTFWNTTRTEYCKSAGYVRQQTFETTRRAESPEYAAALERLRHTRRRTCDPETFAAYARIRGETFEAMRREANRLSRKTRKYHTRRRTQQRLDKIADDLVFGRGVVADSKVLKQRRRQCLRQRRRSWRQSKKSATPEGTDFVPKKSVAPEGTDFVPARTTEDDDLKRTKRQKLDSDGSWTDAFATPERLARPVFFGNGSWKSSGIPRKVLVKKISTRGICVITDEYLTSQSCPCCGGRKTLKNIERGSRLRYCTNSRTGTCSLSGFDRDVLGSFNIGLSAIWGLLGKSGRPPHLARLPR